MGRRLRDVADVRFSNVDKVSRAGERPVRLCNYTDVYNNDYITARMGFMEATATPSEIGKFGLRVGDVLLTKDSETPNDIGIPTVVDETADDLVCGYHLALIRPDIERVDPTYLSKQLGHHRIAGYFGQQANGSTRYGLSTSSIEQAPLELPRIEDQIAIGRILRLVDAAIQKTEAVIAKLKQIRAGMLHDVLTYGLDKDGKLRDPIAHPEQFKDSELGRIPKDWQVDTVSSLAVIPIKKLDWESLIPRIGMAQAAVARFDGILQAMMNPELLLSPLTTQEAVLSSKIEGTQASLEDVLQYDVAPRADAEHRDDIQEVQNYREAMRKAVGWLKKSGLTVDVIRRTHKVLLSGVRGQGKTPGKVRTTQNYIGYRGEPIEKAIFIPPSPGALPNALADLEGFCGTTQRDTIVQTALVHAQFELLHPFLDGNGRVGRILIPLMLLSKGLISRPTFYISEYFEENRPHYYRRLAAISEEQDWQGWSEFFLTAVSEQAELNARRAGAMLRLYNDMKDEINRVTRSQHALETLDALFASPFMTKSDFVKRTKIATRSAERLLPQLESAGILTVAEPGSGSRPTVFVFKRLLAITEQREGF